MTSKHPPPEFWCNRCSNRLKLDTVPESVTSIGSGVSVKAYLTSCGHAVCQNCKQRCGDACPNCSKKCKTIEINEQMPPQLRILFGSVPQELANAHQKINDVRKFQNKQDAVHRKKLKHDNHRYQVMQQTEQVEVQRVKQEFEDHRVTNMKMRVIVEMLKRHKRAQQQPKISPKTIPTGYHHSVRKSSPYHAVQSRDHHLHQQHSYHPAIVRSSVRPNLNGNDSSFHDSV